MLEDIQEFTNKNFPFNFEIFSDPRLKRDEKYRRILFTLFLIIGIPTLLSFALFHGIQNDWPNLLINCGLAGILFSGLLLLRKFKLDLPLYRFTALFYGAFMIYLALIGGEQGSRILWLYSYPLVTFYLLGRWEGLSWNLLLLLILGWAQYFSMDWRQFDYSQQFEIRFLSSFLLVNFMSFFFEMTRDHWQQQLVRDRLRTEEVNARLQVEIREREKIESKYRNSNEKLRTLLAIIPYGIQEVDLNGTLIYANDALAGILDFPKDELIGKKISSFMPEAKDQERMDEVLTGLDQHTFVPFSHYQKSKTRSGEIIDTQTDWNYKLDESGAVIGLIAVVTDITEKVKNEQQLRDYQENLEQEIKLRTAELSHSNEKLKEEVQERKLREEETRILAQFPEENPNPVLRIYRDGTILYANRSSIKLLEDWDTRINGKLPNHWHEQIAQCLDSQKSNQIETIFKNRTYGFVLSPIINSNTIYLYGKDITDKKQYEQQLQLMASIFEHTLEGIVVTDPQGQIEKVNPGFTRITGFSADEAVGQKTNILKSGRHDRAFYTKMWRALHEKGFWQGEIWNRKKNKEVFPERLSISSIKNGNNEVIHYIAVFSDISAIKRTEEKLEYQAYHDALTGLPNRQLFYDRLATSIAYAKRHQEKLAVFFIDLDNFKTVNDTMGHHMGDLLLQEFSHHLIENCREVDTIARLGGDEFTMIMTNVKNPQTAVFLITRLQEEISGNIEIQGHRMPIGMSVGITLFPDDGLDVETLVKNADMAMYRAKEQGKNRYSLFAPSMNEAVQHRLHMEKQMNDGLETGEFEVYYQPKINVATGEISGAEALVRWFREDKKMISPVHFIPLAEETKLIIPLGEWVLRSACRQTKQWHDQGFEDFSIAVNLSGVQFQQKNLVQMVQDILQETGLPAQSLNLELTENILMHNIENAIKVIASFSDMGISISIDDFGTGYSSLSYLKQFRLNVLKIDRSFVRDLPDNSDDVAISKAILSLAKSLNLKVVAEGVEKQEQLGFLSDWGCDEVQGFFFSKPVDHRAFFKLLNEGKNRK